MKSTPTDIQEQQSCLVRLHSWLATESSVPQPNMADIAWVKSRGISPQHNIRRYAWDISGTTGLFISSPLSRSSGNNHTTTRPASCCTCVSFRNCELELLLNVVSCRSYVLVLVESLARTNDVIKLSTKLNSCASPFRYTKTSDCYSVTLSFM